MSRSNCQVARSEGSRPDCGTGASGLRRLTVLHLLDGLAEGVARLLGLADVRDQLCWRRGRQMAVALPLSGLDCRPTVAVYANF